MSFTAPLPRFVVVDELGAEAGRASFFRAVLQRVQPRLFLWACGLLICTQVFGRIGNLASKGLYKPPTHWQSTLIIESLFICSVMIAVLIADEAVARGARRWPTYLLALVAACAFAAWAEWELLTLLRMDNFWSRLEDPFLRRSQPFSMFFTALVYSTIGCFVYVNFRTARLAADRMRAAELARAQARRHTLESRLQAMQARVEPQFLFNTLAQVRELYERDEAVAGQVLDDLITYLRAALPHLRESSSTLGKEVELARSYLDIMCVRLGDRLSFEIDVPDAVKGARMPPMMLLPLVDHALVYGLQPGNDRGSIRSKPRPGPGGSDSQSATAVPGSSKAGRTPASRASASACTRSMATTPASSSTGYTIAAREQPWRYRMKSPTCVIAEDEPVLRTELRETLAALWPELVIVAAAEDGLEALRALHQHRPQLLFLDIEMPGMTGLEVAAQASRQCHVVFVTAYDKYAIEAFEQGAVDYVLKPFSAARLAGTVTRLKERLDSQPADLDGLLASLARREGAPTTHLRWIKASQGQNVRLITVEEVLFFGPTTSTRWSRRRTGRR